MVPSNTGDYKAVLKPVSSAEIDEEEEQPKGSCNSGESLEEDVEDSYDGL